MQHLQWDDDNMAAPILLLDHQGTMAVLHAGEASAGKSNMCLQLLLNAQLPLAQGGFNGGAM